MCFRSLPLCRNSTPCLKYPVFAPLRQAFQTGIVSRPSDVTGKKDQDVTDAYIQAVHSVLTGEKSAPEAAVAWRMNWLAPPVSKRERPKEIGP